MFTEIENYLLPWHYVSVYDLTITGYFYYQFENYVSRRLYLEFA